MGVCVDTESTAGAPVYTVIVPVYNSEHTLRELAQRITAVFELSVRKNHEIVFVDDGSADRSWETLLVLHEQDKRIKIIRHMCNFGQHNALMCGMKHGAGDFFITIDDDLQNPPEEIPKLIGKIGEGFDLVYGEYVRKVHGSMRNLGSRIVQTVYRRVFRRNYDLTAFRIITRQLAESVLDYDKNFVFLDGLLAWNSRNVGTVEVFHEPRRTGRSGYHLGKLITLSLNLVTNFSIFPLQIASLVGILFALIGAGVGVFLVFKKIMLGIPVAGYASMMVAICLLSGIQLLSLGLIGEYLGRVHIGNSGRAQFRIREKRL